MVATDAKEEPTPPSAALDSLLVALAVQRHGESDWEAVSAAVEKAAAQLGGTTPRPADACRSAFAALGGGDLAAHVERLRAERAAELKAEASKLEKHAERLERDIEAIDSGKLDAQALLALLPPAHPIHARWAADASARAAAGAPPSKATMAQLVKTLNVISKHKWAYPFKRPVTDKEAPDYRQIVKQPMDFSTIRKRIDAGIVVTADALQVDLDLVFSNAMLYNGVGSDYYKMAQSLQEHARAEFAKMRTDSANSGHLSPEASELLRGSGVAAGNLTASRLRSSQPAGSDAGGGADDERGGDEGAAGGDEGGGGAVVKQEGGGAQSAAGSRKRGASTPAQGGEGGARARSRR